MGKHSGIISGDGEVVDIITGSPGWASPAKLSDEGITVALGKRRSDGCLVIVATSDGDHGEFQFQLNITMDHRSDDPIHRFEEVRKITWES